MPACLKPSPQETEIREELPAIERTADQAEAQIPCLFVKSCARQIQVTVKTVKTEKSPVLMALTVRMECPLLRHQSKFKTLPRRKSNLGSNPGSVVEAAPRRQGNRVASAAPPEQTPGTPNSARMLNQAQTESTPPPETQVAREPLDFVEPSPSKVKIYTQTQTVALSTTTRWQLDA